MVLSVVYPPRDASLQQLSKLCFLISTLDILGGEWPAQTSQACHLIRGEKDSHACQLPSMHERFQKQESFFQQLHVN